MDEKSHKKTGGPRRLQTELRDQSPRNLEGSGNLTIGTSAIQISTVAAGGVDVILKSLFTNRGTIFIGKIGLLNDGSNHLAFLEPGDPFVFRYNGSQQPLYAIASIPNQLLSVGETIQ